MTPKAMLIGFVFLLCSINPIQAMEFLRKSKERAKTALKKVKRPSEKSKEGREKKELLSPEDVNKDLDNRATSLNFQKFLNLMQLLKEDFQVDQESSSGRAQSTQAQMYTLIEVTPSILTTVDGSGDSLLHKAILEKNNPALAFLLSLTDLIEGALVIRNGGDLTPWELAQKLTKSGDELEIFDQLTAFIEELVWRKNFQSFADYLSSSNLVATRIYTPVEEDYPLTKIEGESAVTEGGFVGPGGTYEPKTPKLVGLDVPQNNQLSTKLRHLLSNHKAKWLFRLCGAATVIAVFYGLKEVYQHLFLNAYTKDEQKTEL